MEKGNRSGASRRGWGVAAILCTLLAACGGGGGGGTTAGVTAATVGEKIFKDTNLSEPGGMSCATCHDPARAYTDSRPQAVSLGVSPGVNPGRFTGRNAPTLRYLAYAPNFSVGSDGPVGGFFWDGRAATLSAQAGGPMLSANEMANPDKASVVAKVKASAYAADFKQVWGANVFDNVDDAFAKIEASVAAYEKEDPDFAPFSSKFDAWRAGKAQLSSDEMAGYVLFNDPNKGNCAACHVAVGPDAKTPPLFTDFSYDALGVPRNTQLPVNADASFFDLGVCGPTRTDLPNAAYCGKFKVPTLRNVAVTGPWFHNGSDKFATLRDVVKFYVTRDTNPELWYPKDAGGNVLKFNDVPAQYQGNVNTQEVPYNRPLGGTPALNDAEIDQVVAFLRALTDGYTP